VQVYLNGGTITLVSVSPDEIQAQIPYDFERGPIQESLYPSQLTRWRNRADVERGRGSLRFGFNRAFFAVGKMEPAQRLAPACEWRTT